MSSDEALATYVRATVATQFHPCGTARMGPARRCHGRDRPALPAPRRPEPARGRRVDHADHPAGQHQPHLHHDRRARVRLDARRGIARRPQTRFAEYPSTSRPERPTGSSTTQTRHIVERAGPPAGPCTTRRRSGRSSTRPPAGACPSGPAERASHATAPTPRRTLPLPQERGPRRPSPRGSNWTTRERAVRACSDDPQPWAKAGANRRGVDRPKRRRTNPSPTGTSIRGRGALQEDHGPPTQAATQSGCSNRRPREAPWVVLNQRPAPRRARRDELIASPSTWWLPASPGGSVRCGTLASPSVIRAPDGGLVLAIPSRRLPKFVWAVSCAPRSGSVAVSSAVSAPIGQSPVALAWPLVVAEVLCGDLLEPALVRDRERRPCRLCLSASGFAARQRRVRSSERCGSRAGWRD